MFEIMSGTIPVLIHIPHDSIVIPKELIDGCNFALTMSDFDSAVIKMSDTGAYEVGSEYRTSCNIGTPYLIKSNVSRMIVDMERFDDEREEMNGIGHGVIYTTSADGVTNIYSDGLPAKIIERRKALYRLYSNTVASIVEQLRNEYGYCLIIDLHSYDEHPAEYELHKDEFRPSICIGTNSKSDESLLSNKLNEYRLLIGFNEPFSGAYIPERFIDDDCVNSVMIEMRKDYCNNNCNYNVINNVLTDIIKILLTPILRSSTYHG